MNMKRINEVPVIEELGENSYVLVDNAGAAARIAGSKVGGGGGNRNEMPDLLYALLKSEPGNLPLPEGMEYYLLCSENDENTLVDYETAKLKLAHDRAVYSVEDGVVALMSTGFLNFADEFRMIFAEIPMVFSDTEFPEA